MAHVIGSGSKGNQPGTAQLTSIVVRAGHVISADQADQLAAPDLQPLRANRAIPGNIFVFARRNRKAGGAGVGRVRVILRGHSCCRENSTLLRLDRSDPFFRGTFHGPTVIAHPLAREKPERLAGGVQTEKE
jgi:hypothetical protein